MPQVRSSLFKAASFLEHYLNSLGCSMAILEGAEIIFWPRPDDNKKNHHKPENFSTSQWQV